MERTLTSNYLSVISTRRAASVLFVTDSVWHSAGGVSSTLPKDTEDGGGDGCLLCHSQNLP